MRNEIGMILIFQRSLTNEMKRIFRLNYGVYIQTGSCSVADYCIATIVIRSFVLTTSISFQSIQSDIDDKVKQGIQQTTLHFILHSDFVSANIAKMIRFSWKQILQNEFA